MGPRIQLMLQQLEFKLSVEMQYKEGTDKMLKLYQIEGDRRSRAETEAKRIESTQKIQLLKKSLKRYNDMHIDIDEQGDDDDSIAMANMRRPLSGVLHISSLAVKNVDHVASGKSFSKLPESFISVKVEGQTRAQTRPSRTERWAEEFDISVDKANEVEISVYDRSGDHHVPVGMMWLKISDIAEALRRKKVEQEINSAGWVSASQVQDGYHQGGSSRQDNAPLGQHQQYLQHGHNGSDLGEDTLPSGLGGPGVGEIDSHREDMTIDAWFVLEPAGQIHLSLGFERTNRGVKRNYDGVGGLGRQGATRAIKSATPRW
jgi:hypothetical protein